MGGGEGMRWVAQLSGLRLRVRGQYTEQYRPAGQAPAPHTWRGSLSKMSPASLNRSLAVSPVPTQRT
jgi:hypothetical protein